MLALSGAASAHALVFEPIHMNLGAQPEAITLQAAGEQAREWKLPRGVKAGAWHYMLTIDTTRAAVTRAKDSSDLASREISYVELLLEARPESQQADKTTYNVFIYQSCVDEKIVKANADAATHVAALRELDAPGPFGTAAPEFTRTVPRVMGVKGQLVVANDGWIDSFSFEYPDDVDPAAVTLSLQVQSALRWLMPPKPAQATGQGAAWNWEEFQPIDGLLRPVKREVKVSELWKDGAPVGERKLRFVQDVSGKDEDTTDTPGVLMLTPSDIEGGDLSLKATGESEFFGDDGSAALPFAANISVTTISGAQWRPEGADAMSPSLEAEQEQVITITLAQHADHLGVFSDGQGETAPAANWSRVDISMPQDFDAATRFVSQLESQLLQLVKPDAQKPEGAPGQGDFGTYEVLLPLNQPMKARASIEDMKRMELIEGETHSIEASSIQLEYEIVLKEEKEDDSVEGVVRVTSAKGTRMLAEREGDAPLKPESASTEAISQDEIDAILNKEIPLTAWDNGMCILRSSDLGEEEHSKLLEEGYDVLNALELALAGLQPKRVVGGLRDGQMKFEIFGKEADDSIASFTQYQASSRRAQ
jgi:hypothetical protein